MDHLSKSLPGNEVRTASCPEHGSYQSRNLIGRIWSNCSQCEAARRAEEEADTAKAQQRVADERRRSMLGRAAIPERFIGRTFDNYKAATDQQRRALTMMRDYAERFEVNRKAGQGLILSGKPGTGKSHLAGAVLQALLGRDVLYATCLDLIRMVRETWRKESPKSEREVLAYLGNLDLLVIDEMGVQYGTEGEQTIMFDVLDMRYRSVKPSILLTNQNSEGLKGYLGERTFDRLRETCKLIEFDWESYRPQARKEAQA